MKLTVNMTEEIKNEVERRIDSKYSISTQLCILADVLAKKNYDDLTDEECDQSMVFEDNHINDEDGYDNEIKPSNNIPIRQILYGDEALMEESANYQVCVLDYKIRHANKECEWDIDSFDIDLIETTNIMLSIPENVLLHFTLQHYYVLDDSIIEDEDADGDTIITVVKPHQVLTTLAYTCSDLLNVKHREGELKNVTIKIPKEYYPEDTRITLSNIEDLIHILAEVAVYVNGKECQ